MFTDDYVHPVAPQVVEGPGIVKGTGATEVVKSNRRVKSDLVEGLPGGGLVGRPVPGHVGV